MKPYYQDNAVTIYQGDAVDTIWKLQPEAVQCVVTSPPYWGLRDYGVDGQIGLEKTPQEYVENIVEIFRQVRDVLRDDGTLWLNLGDSYARDFAKGGSGPNGKHDFIPDYGNARKIMSESKGSSDGFVSRGDRAPVRVGADGLKPKDLVGIPWRVAFALQADGWYLRSDIIWSKPNPMPESVTDRPTKSHEYIFLLSKKPRYYFDADAIAEPFADDRCGNPGGGGQYAVDAFKLLGTQRGLAKGEWNTDRSKTTRNIRSVWTIATQPYPEAHFATFPEDLVKPCVLAGSRPGDIVMDCFAGSGTALYVAKELGRKGVGIELKAEYIDLAAKRLRQEVLNLEARE